MRYTSRVFVAGEALHAALSALTFPPHPTTNKTPSVEFSDEDPAFGNETICVSLDVDNTASEWRRLSPPGRDETITFDVVIRTTVPNVRTSAAVFDRLEALSAVVESVTYNTTTNTVTPLGVPGEVLSGLVTAVRPQVSPGSDGWVGWCVVSFRFAAQV